MSGTRTETIPLVDDTALEVSVGRPAGSVRGGIVVLPAGAVTARIEEILGVLAGDGWLAVAPHHHASDAAGGAGGPVAAGAVLADSDVCFGWLAYQGVGSDRMGVLGFDRGATAALVVASQRSLGAAVTVAASGVSTPLADGLPALLDVVGELTCPWLGLYGETDDSIDPADVESLREAAHASDRVVDVVVYPAQDHRFDVGTAASRTDAATVDADEAIAEARSRVLNWFDAHLR